MPAVKQQNIKNLQFRAKLPIAFRVLAIFAIALTIFAIGIGFYLSRNNREFRMKSLPAELSQDVVAEVSGYERRETDGEKLKYYIKADKARTFTDNHQELENAFIQVFDETGENSDKISSATAIYVPAKDESKNFTAYFAGNVNIESRDALKVKTEQLTYYKETEDKTIELLKDVEINSNDATGKIEQAKIAAGHAFFNQTAGKIEFSQNVNINITANNSGELAQPTDIKSDRATAFFTNQEINKVELNGNVDVYQKPTSASSKWTKTKANRAVVKIEKELKQLELFENVDIETTANNSKPTRIKTNYALYDKDADKFELKNAVDIVTIEDNQPTTIRSQNAVYEQSNGKIFLVGAAEIQQGNDFIKGDNLTAELFPNKKLKNAFAKGSAYLKQATSDRTTEVSGNELNASYGDNQQLQSANAVGAGQAILTPTQAKDYTKISLAAPNAIRLNFRPNGRLEQMQTDGRTMLSLNAPNNNQTAANKKLTADKVKTVFNENGKDLTKAEAVGNAELFVEPLRAAPENYKTTVNAPRFDCEFFETGNNAKNCAASGNAKGLRVPTAPAENRGNQNISAERLDVKFSQENKDVERFDAFGNAKFSELDRNGIANQLTFTAGDEFVRLRGGEPTVWDSRARAKAGEIDWDTRSEKSALRGKVSTTYYSQKQTGGATPFANASSPVFVTSETADFDHRAETGLYAGNARAWQENNYVRADKLLVNQKEGRLFGEGTVQSLLYDAKRKENGKETSVPVYAAAQKLSYDKDKNILRYETNVDIRQGADRIVAGAANVFLNDKNEVSQTVAENNVVITQPNRKVVGEYAQYNMADETVVLRGNPARVEDSENGSSQGAQLTLSLRDKRIEGESKTRENNTGRMRTVYKVKKQ
jgi:lipopolysaccharide export system protein LptA